MTKVGDFTARAAVEGNLLDRIDRLERRLRALENRPVVARTLDEITSDMGTQQAGGLNLDGLSYGITHTATDSQGNQRAGRLGFFNDARGVPNWVLDHIGVGNSLNLLTNPSFEDTPALTGWTSEGWSNPSVHTSYKVSGRQGFIGELIIPSLNGAQVCLLTSSPVQVVAGADYSALFYKTVYGFSLLTGAATITITCRCQISWYDQDDVLISTHDGPETSFAYTEYNYPGLSFSEVASGTTIAPDNAVAARMIIYVSGQGSNGYPANGETYIAIDHAVMLTEKRSAQLAFDGDAIFYGDYLRDNADDQRFCSCGLRLPAPTAPYATKSLSSTAPLPLSSYYYRCTYEDFCGVETPASPIAQASNDATNRAIAVYLANPQRNVAKINIYRRVSGQSNYYYLTSTYPADRYFIDEGTIPVDTNRQPPTVNLTRGADQHPHRVFMTGGEGYSSYGSAILRFNNTSQALGMYWRYDGLSAMIQWDFTFHAPRGVYDFEAVGLKAASGMQMDIYLDGVKLNASLIEQYAATTTYNQSYAYPDVSLDYTGWHTVSFKAMSKNASSSGYKLFLSFFTLTSAEPVMP